jgi:DNA-nicking Smr family endonuclease
LAAPCRNDLHGFTSDEARRHLVQFLDDCRNAGLRCVRVIHGKGLCSINREPVLKFKTANWLMQRADVLAFCQARAADGGGGALVVLLKGAARKS